MLMWTWISIRLSMKNDAERFLLSNLIYLEAFVLSLMKQCAFTFSGEGDYSEMEGFGLMRRNQTMRVMNHESRLTSHEYHD